jgi:plasmid replication initiation protein
VPLLGVSAMIRCLQLPDRHYTHMQPDQLAFDLRLDSPLMGRAKNDRNLMVYAWFALTREKQTELPVYNDGKVRIEITGTKHGVANIWDAELLIYMASIIQDRLNRGLSAEQVVSFTAHDFFRITGTKPGGSSYDRLEKSLVRLRGTLIRTNIETGGEGEAEGFGWIDNYKIQYRRGRGGEKVMKAVQVRICDWLHRAIVRDRRMLTYDPRYFDLGPIEKRLYEIARAHCGNQNGFKIGLEKLHRRVGTTMELRFFKAELVKIAKRRNPLPEYGFMLVDPRVKLSLDRKALPPPGRTPLKSWMVFFFRTDRLAQMPVFAQAPEVEDDFPASELPS